MSKKFLKKNEKIKKPGYTIMQQLIEILFLFQRLKAKKNIKLVLLQAKKDKQKEIINKEKLKKLQVPRRPDGCN